MSTVSRWYCSAPITPAAVKPFVPKGSPRWIVFAVFGVSLLICDLFLRSLEKQRLFLKL